MSPQLEFKTSSYTELAVTRDAMIKNPRFTFFCLNADDYNSLENLFI